LICIAEYAIVFSYGDGLWELETEAEGLSELEGLSEVEGLSDWLELELGEIELDGETEAEFSAAISSMKNEVTFLVIAHRLSTVRNADRVIYIADGGIVATGKFEDLRTLVPNFDKQAKLIGL
jgi:hypothetical protein